MESLPGRGTLISVVLDSSATQARVYPEASTPHILELFRKIALSNAWVPTLWKLDIANSLSISLRRGRLDQDGRKDIFRLLDSLPIDIDDETEQRAWTNTLVFADRHRLTLYDAAYLELAHRLSIPLATLDMDLRRAAQAESVPLLGL